MFPVKFKVVAGTYPDIQKEGEDGFSAGFYWC